MKILVDTNVILDIALERQPFVEQAIQLVEAAQGTKDEYDSILEWERFANEPNSCKNPTSN